MEPPLVKIDPPRGQRQTAEADTRRKVLSEALAAKLARPVIDENGIAYRIAAVYLEEIGPKEKECPPSP